MSAGNADAEMSSPRQEKVNGAAHFVCPYCERVFNKKANCKIHMRKHTGEMPYTCQIQGCGRKFMWKSSLSFHETSGHAGEILIDRNGDLVTPKPKRARRTKPKEDATSSVSVEQTTPPAFARAAGDGEVPACRSPALETVGSVVAESGAPPPGPREYETAGTGEGRVLPPRGALWAASSGVYTRHDTGTDGFSADGLKDIDLELNLEPKERSAYPPLRFASPRDLVRQNSIGDCALNSLVTTGFVAQTPSPFNALVGRQFVTPVPQVSPPGSWMPFLSPLKPARF